MHEWNVACDVAISQFLTDIKLGTPPADFDLPLTKTGSSEEQLYREFCENGVGLNFSKLGTVGGRDDDMLWQSEIAVVAQTQTKRCPS